MADNTETKLVRGAVLEDKTAGSNWGHAGSVIASSKCMFVDTKGMTEKEAKAAQSAGYTGRIEQKCDASVFPKKTTNKNDGETIDTFDEDGNIRWGVVSFATKVMKPFYTISNGIRTLAECKNPKTGKPFGMKKAQEMIIPKGKAISRPAIGKLIAEYKSDSDDDTSDALQALCNGVKMVVDSLPKIDLEDDLEIVNAEYAKCLRAFGEALVKKAA